MWFDTDPETIVSCIVETSRQMSTDERQVVVALETRYQGITALYNRYMSSLSRLPPELSALIMSQATVQDVHAMAQTSLLYRQTARDPVVWRGLIETEWGQTYTGDDPVREYRRLKLEYISHSEAQSIARTLKRILVDNLPDTVAARPLRSSIVETGNSYTVFWEGRAQTVELDQQPPHHTFGAVSYDFSYSSGKSGDLYERAVEPWCMNANRLSWERGWTQYINEQVYALYPSSKYTLTLTLDLHNNGVSVISLLLDKVPLSPALAPVTTLFQPRHPRTSIQPSDLPVLSRLLKQALSDCLRRGKNGLTPDATKFQALLDKHTVFWAGAFETGSSRPVGAVYTLGESFQAADMPGERPITSLTCKIIYSFRQHYISGDQVGPVCVSLDKPSLLGAPNRQFEARGSVAANIVAAINRLLVQQGFQHINGYADSLIESGATAGAIQAMVYSL